MRREERDSTDRCRLVEVLRFPLPSLFIPPHLFVPSFSFLFRLRCLGGLNSRKDLTFLGCLIWALDLLLFEEGCVALVPRAKKSIARWGIEGLGICKRVLGVWEHWL